MTALESLHPSLQYHIVNSLGWPDLRPLQKAALPALLGGEHGLLLAPTAGGKTEAAAFPLLSRMLSEDWPALSVLYVCPLRALLNDLGQRLEHYSGLLGRRAGVWHGDIRESAKAAMRRAPPDLLLTTPESLEGLLVSRRLDARAFFANVQAVVIDEIHAFAGDDRGWHLLAVLARIEHLAGRELQRVGLSATVGNPEALLDWLVGDAAGPRQVIVDPGSGRAEPPEVQLDWVGTLANAAKVIGALYRGKKRMVFCDSRARTEELAHGLRRLQVSTFVSHSSLGRDVRRNSEQAFTEAAEGVIVATSTLELGIDLGDLDHVLQIDAPSRVASFLQRLGRTGRRPGTRASCLFLATHPQGFLRALAIVQLWSEGYVEPVTPPPYPYHVLVQQLLALCLQQGGVARDEWQSWLLSMHGFSSLEPTSIEALSRHLVEQGILWLEGGRLWLGAQGEKRYQHRNFLELLSMITDSPLFTVLHGQQELGQVDRTSFLVRPERTPVLLLAGRSWSVEHIDWKKKRCWVSAADDRGHSRWIGEGPALSFELCQAMRRVLSGEATPPGLSRRAESKLEEMREEFAGLVATEGTVFEPVVPRHERWWTFAGLLGNATLLGHLRSHFLEPPKFDNLSILLTEETAHSLRKSRRTSSPGPLDSPTPQLDEKAIEALKFAELLPPDLQADLVRARWSDPHAARSILHQPAALVPGGSRLD